MKPRLKISEAVLAVLPPARRKLWMTALEIAVVAELRGARSLHPALERLARIGKIQRRKDALGRWEYAR